MLSTRENRQNRRLSVCIPRRAKACHFVRDRLSLCVIAFRILFTRKTAGGKRVNLMNLPFLDQALMRRPQSLSACQMTRFCGSDEEASEYAVRASPMNENWRQFIEGDLFPD